MLNPSVHAFSYVDNVSEAGHLVMDVVKAFFSTICFFQLWGLTLDGGKTYFWSTTPASRDLLRLLGLTQQKEALELGGSMTFDAMRRNRQLRSRGDRLQDKWERLRRSPCPLSQKFTVLPLLFGPPLCMGRHHARWPTTTSISCDRRPIRRYVVNKLGPMHC